PTRSPVMLPLVDSPEFVFVEWAADELLPETEFAAHHVAELSSTALHMLRPALFMAWQRTRREPMLPMLFVCGRTYRELADRAHGRDGGVFRLHDRLVFVPGEA